MSLSQSTAVVIGASGGIGRAVAVALAERGARLVLVGRDAARLEETRSALSGAAGAAASVFTCDVTRLEEVQPLAGEIGAAVGAVDILVNAAGLNVRNRGLRVLAPEDW